MAQTAHFCGSFIWNKLPILTIVIRNGKIVWKLGPNGPFLLNNLCTAENSTQSFSTCNKCKKAFLRESQTLQNLTIVKFLIAFNSVIKFYMPGDNCVIPGSFTSRATPGVTLLGMPKNYNEYNVNWRKNIVDMIATIRVVDASKLFLRKTLVNLTKKIEKSTVPFYTNNILLEPLLATLNMLLQVDFPMGVLVVQSRYNKFSSKLSRALFQCYCPNFERVNNKHTRLHRSFSGVFIAGFEQVSATWV